MDTQQTGSKKKTKNWKQQLKAVEMHAVDKLFHIYKNQKRSLRSLFIRHVEGVPQKVPPSTFSLKNVTLSISAGETWALIGANGSGKSTLLRLMAGIYWPTRGRIIIRGRLAPLIELGAGFHLELTGRENIYLYGNIIGMTNKELNKLFGLIVEFSGVKKFIDTPLKYYSSGMKMRLGFSVATAVMPDILLLDEILAVGDANFHNRCIERIKTFQAKGCTMVLATHDLDMAEAMTGRAIWMDQGQVRKQGKTLAVLEAYRKSFLSPQLVANLQQKP
jgi:ABC-2 type transport system ATP-binding protein